MSHSPIIFRDVCLSFPQKVCFEGLTTQVHAGNRIALIGQNGCGKSSLLKIIQGLMKPTQGSLVVPADISSGHVPQVIEDFANLSGAERLNQSLTQVLTQNPNILLLDEPTNHLDGKNRRSLLRFLCRYQGTLVVATHDMELLETCIDILWHIEGGQVHIFQGTYSAYMQERSSRRTAMEKELAVFHRDKVVLHQALMQEQRRAKTSRARGEKHIDQRKWPTIVSSGKARRAVETAGKKAKAIIDNKEELVEKLTHIRVPEIMTPTFTLACGVVTSRTIVSIKEGAVGYDAPLLQAIALSLKGGERLAIKGRNGSGKSTLLKAIGGLRQLIKSGEWHLPKAPDIGILDQHYATLNPTYTVLETIQERAPDWSHADSRKHLNDFLFRKNEEVQLAVAALSGGEKARLSLAQIAVQAPQLLLLDEITNNLDLETREHIVQILNAYPGAIIAISHDENFLEAIQVETHYDVEAWQSFK